MDSDRGHLQFIASFGGAREITFVFSKRSEARYHLIPFGDLIFDLVISGRRFPENLESLLQPVPARRQTRKRWRIMIVGIWSHQFVHRIEIAFVNFFVKSAYKSLVGFS